MRYSKVEEKKEVKEVTESKENKFNLKECFALWLHSSKSGIKYLSGFDFNKNKIVGFFNKKSKDEQPEVRIYGVNEDGTMGEEIITLWIDESRKGNKYLSGITNENEKIIAYYGDEHKEMRPYIRGYFKN